MPVQDRSTLKGYFNKGDVPSESDFADLIDTIFDGAATGYQLHKSTHQHGGADEIATATGGPNLIPKADGTGKLDVGWIPEHSSSHDHGLLSGRSDDDHTQYLNLERHDTTDRHTLGSVVPHDTLDGILAPTGDVEFTMANKHFELRFTAPVIGAGVDGAFEVEGIGAFSGDLVHIHQHTGNPAAGTDLLHLEASDVDVCALNINHANASGVLAVFNQNNGDIFKITNKIESRTIEPFLSDAYDLGTSTKLWRKGWLSELDTVLFAQNTITTLGGWFMVSKGEGVIPADIPAETGSHSYTFTSSASLEVNDFIVFKLAGQTEYMQVTAAASPDFTVTRNVDNSGANLWPAGSVFVNLGYNGDGHIELNALDSPRISVKKQLTTYSGATELLRIGDLNGQWGYAQESYGMAIGDYGTNKPNITFDTTNGIRIRNNATTVMQFDVSGNATISNKLRMLDSTSAITIGLLATLPSSSTVGTGIWLDRTGMYGLAANVLQVKFDAATGKITAGAGDVILDVNGVTITNISSAQPRNILKFDSGASGGWDFSCFNGGSVQTAYSDLTGSNTYVHLRSLGAAEARITLKSSCGAYGVDPAIELSKYSVSGTANIDFVSTSFRFQGIVQHLEQTAPGTPGTNYLTEYALTNGYPMAKNDAGVVIPRFVSRLPLPILHGYYVGAAIVTIATNTKAVAFRDNNMDIIYGNVNIPAGWGGKTVVPNVVWAPSNATAGNVRISFEVRHFTAGVTVGVGANSAQTATAAAPGVNDRVVKTAVAAVTVGAEGSSLQFALYRNAGGGDPNDTFAGSMHLLSLELVLV